MSISMPDINGHKIEAELIDEKESMKFVVDNSWWFVISNIKVDDENDDQLNFTVDYSDDSLDTDENAEIAKAVMSMILENSIKAAEEKLRVA